MSIVLGETELDYALDDFIAADTPQRMKALGDPLRSLVLDLVLERAMSVSELAQRVGRPRGSVAHHVDVLLDAGLLQVVRTRRVRAVTERFYGRTARTIGIESDDHDLPFFRDAREQADIRAMKDDEVGGGFTLRHARIPAARAKEFMDRVQALALEFTTLRREGDREYAFLAGVFPTHRPVAPTTTEQEEL
jgi:DNA-binding transcriptional ArsR family regulator